MLGRCYKENISDGACPKFEPDAYDFYAMCGPNVDDSLYKCDEATLHNGLIEELPNDYQCKKRPTAIPPKTDNSDVDSDRHSGIDDGNGSQDGSDGAGTGQDPSAGAEASSAETSCTTKCQDKGLNTLCCCCCCCCCCCWYYFGYTVSDGYKTAAYAKA